MNKHAKGSIATWVSNGPVQINVERELNIYGGGTCSADIPDDCVLPRASGKSSWSTLLKVGGAAVALVIGVAAVLAIAELAASAVAWGANVVAAIAATVVTWVTSAVAWSTLVCLWIVRIVLGGWMVGRAAELYLLLERWLGGGPWRLILFTKLFGQRDIEIQVQPCSQPEPPQCMSSTPQLTASKPRALHERILRPSAGRRREPTASTI